MVPDVMTFYAAEDRVRARPAATLFGVQPCGETLLVRVPDAAIPRSTIVGRLLDTDGRPPEKARVSCSAAGMRGKPSANVNAATGEFRIGPLPAGTYRVQGSIGDQPSRRSAWSEPMVVQGGEVRDVGVVQMPETGSIALTAGWSRRTAARCARRRVGGQHGLEREPMARRHAGPRRTAHRTCSTGAYRVRIGGEQNLPTLYEPVTVTAGQETRVELRVPNGVAVELGSNQPLLSPCRFTRPSSGRATKRRLSATTTGWKAMASSHGRGTCYPAATKSRSPARPASGSRTASPSQRTIRQADASRSSCRSSPLHVLPIPSVHDASDDGRTHLRRRCLRHDSTAKHRRQLMFVPQSPNAERDCAREVAQCALHPATASRQHGGRGGASRSSAECHHSSVRWSRDAGMRHWQAAHCASCDPESRRELTTSSLPVQ